MLPRAGIADRATSRRAVRLVLAVLVAVTATGTDAAGPPAKETARSSLAGVWELRNDDLRSGKLILAPDGSLTATSSMEDFRNDFHGAWTLVSQDGSKYVLEFGSSPGALGSSLVTVVRNCPDAFTIVEVEQNSVRTRDQQQRFVRTGPAPSKSR